MRIIAGKHRGRNLLPPVGNVTRPITDRAKQSLFDILAFKIPGARVFDCFAGTGSMGLECLSRGAERVELFEADRSALERLKKNVAAMDDERRCQVIGGDLFKYFDRTWGCADGFGQDIIFLDPPYRFLRERPDDLRKLAATFANVLLDADGVIVFRHDIGDLLELPSLKRYDHREYGGMMLEFLTRSIP